MSLHSELTEEEMGERYGGDIDCLSAICPKCGLDYTAPDCSCGYVVGSDDIDFTLAKCAGGYTNTALQPWRVTPQSLVNELSGPVIGNKDGSYFLRCNGTTRNNAGTDDTAHIIILDGDSRINDDGEIKAGAPAPAEVSEILTKLGLTHFIYSSHSNAATQAELTAKDTNSGGAYGADYYKYRVVIPCSYTPEQLPALLNHIFSKLHRDGVMLVDVTENRTWSQAWYFPRVPDADRLSQFEFHQHTGSVIDADAIYSRWEQSQPVRTEPKQQPVKIKIDESNGRINSIKAFNQTFSVHDVLIRNGYIKKGIRYLRPDSGSKVPAIQLCEECHDGVERIYSHGGDVLNDTYAHDAFDCYRFLQLGDTGAKPAAIAFDWSPEIQKHNRNINRQEKAAQQKTPPNTQQAKESLSIVEELRLIATFNQTFTPNDFLLNAEHTLSVNELYSSGQGARNAFDTFTLVNHGGDKAAALKDAGDNFLTFGDVSFNEAAKLARDGQKIAPLVDAPKIAPVFKLVSANELMSRSIKHDWQIKGLFEHGNIGQIFGATGSGKSFVVLDMSYCIAAGLDYCGKPTKRGNVVYICGEGFDGLNRRLQALKGKYKADIGENIFISEKPGAFIDIDVTIAVADAIKSIGDVSLVIIDTLHRNMGGGNENSADDFGVVLRNIDTFLKPLGVTVMLIHHSGHGETERSRGSSSIRAAMDFEYKTTLTADTLTLTNTKMKDAGTPPPMAFDFVQVELGTDDDGEAITSAYLDSKEGGAVQSGTKSRLNARDDAILTSLNDAITSHGIEPSADIKAKFGGFDSLVGKYQKIVHIGHWRKLAYKVITIDDGGSDPAQALRKSFKRTREKLQDAGYIVVAGNYAWRFFDDNAG